MDGKKQTFISFQQQPLFRMDLFGLIQEKAYLSINFKTSLIMNDNYYCIIMAGGAGRRFWPHSRMNRPKQFLDFFGTGQNLLQQTFERYKQIIPASHIFITTHKDYKDLVVQSLPELGEEQLIIENERRNTAPSIAHATYIIGKANPNATIVVAPCDHLILKSDAFQEAILKGLDFASCHDKLLTIGIRPHRPETGYGYIQIADEKEGDFYKVKTFIEKPAKEFAEIFVQSNEFFWNSGIFVWHVDTIRKAFHEIMPDICPRVETDTPDFTACPNISIDYSIMEKASNVYVQLCDFGWADLGTWEALYDVSAKDKENNVIVNCNTLLYNCKNNIISIPEGQLAVIQDLDGYLITAQDNVLLICKKDDQDSIRKFVNDVEMKFGEKYS